MLIAELKDQIDIVEVAGSYTELQGRGNRLRAKPNPLREGGDLDVYQDTQKFYDHGTGEGGDVVDFIETVENLSKSDALSFLQEKYLSGADISSNYIPIPRMQSKPVKRDNDLLLANIAKKASELLQATPPMGTVNLNRRAKEKYSMVEVNGVNTIRVAPIFEKLLEGYLIPSDEKFADYLFSKVIGYDSYYHCPAIILRDESETVVDIIRYRPERSGKPLKMKYLYMSATDRPDSEYLFPLQAQMMRIILDQGYCFVGEGLKNAVNASLVGIPFISIEGAGNIKPKLIMYLKSNRMKDVVMIGAFDGDGAGERAYKQMCAEIPMENEFTFDSNMDFAEYLKEIR